MSSSPQPRSATAGATVSQASRMLQYVNEEQIYLYADGAWRSFATSSTDVMQRVQDAFGVASTFQVWVWYTGDAASNVQITSVTS